MALKKTCEDIFLDLLGMSNPLRSWSLQRLCEIGVKLDHIAGYTSRNRRTIGEFRQGRLSSRASQYLKLVGGLFQRRYSRFHPRT